MHYGQFTMVIMLEIETYLVQRIVIKQILIEQQVQNLISLDMD